MEGKSRVAASGIRAAVLFLGGGLVAVAFFGVPVRTGNSGPVTSENGDVNGDGMIDVSDAVYTLLHTSKDGPAPVAIAHDKDLLERIAVAVEEIADPCENRRTITSGEPRRRQGL